MAVQLRQNTKTIRATSLQELTENINKAAVLLVEPENAELYLRGSRSYSDLTPEEKFRFGQLISILVNRMDSLLEFQRLGLVRESYVETRMMGTQLIFSNPGVREYWERFGHRIHTPELCEWIKKIVAAQQAEEADVE